MPLTCYLDAFSGISGDMLVGALADAGADTGAIAAAVASLEAGAVVSFEKVKRNGIGATKYHVAAEEAHAHRHLSHIVKMIEKAALSTARQRKRHRRVPPPRRSRSAGPPGAHRKGPLPRSRRGRFHRRYRGRRVAFDLLDVDTIVCSAVNVGSGTVKTEHGVLPVPAPATALLLAGAPVYSRGPEVELTTPTGAAIAVTLAKRFGALPPMKIARTGFGAGTHDFPGQANVLRVILGEPTGADEALAVSVIEANIDDLNPQVLAFAMEKLLEFGALDVSLQPILMKKGRPGHLLRVIAKPEHREALAQIVFSETSTFGLRIYAAERRVQARSWKEVETQYGKVRVKVSSEGYYAPEYEDCRKLALASGVALKHIIAEANFAYLNQTR